MIKAYCLHETDRWDGPLEGLLYYIGDCCADPDMYYYRCEEVGYPKNYEAYERDEEELEWEERTFAVIHLYIHQKKYLLESIVDWNTIGPCEEFYDKYKPLCKIFHEEIQDRKPLTILKSSEIEWSTMDSCSDSWKKHPKEEQKKYL